LKSVLDELMVLGVQSEKIECKKLDRMVDGKNHQGIVVAVELSVMHNEDQLKWVVEVLQESVFYLVLDQV